MTPMRYLLRYLRAIAIVALGLTAEPVSALAEGNSGPRLVILVRHAEPAAAPADDPGLAMAGHLRAAALMAALRDAGVTAIFTSTLRRTRETAQPLADALGIAAVPVDGGNAHIAALAAAVRGAQGAVLVVGHSNTVPELIAELGGPSMSNLCNVFDRLFVLAPGSGRVHLVRGRYGATQPDPGPDCP
jgi:broad specificity phosphatase PhoE